MNIEAPLASTLRERRKAETRDLIVDALAACLTDADISAITFAEVAKRAGVTERTVYRYFPTRDELFRALWEWLSSRGGVTRPRMPSTEAELTAMLRPFYTGFDTVAPQMQAVLRTPQGREMRASLNPERTRAFLAAIDDAAGDLPAADKRKAAAAIQLLHSAAAWAAMREDWGLDGEAAAEACAWAIDTLLKDLRRRDGRPLAEEE